MLWLTGTVQLLGVSNHSSFQAFHLIHSYYLLNKKNSYPKKSWNTSLDQTVTAVLFYMHLNFIKTSYCQEKGFTLLLLWFILFIHIPLQKSSLQILKVIITTWEAMDDGMRICNNIKSKNKGMQGVRLPTTGDVARSGQIIHVLMCYLNIKEFRSSPLSRNTECWQVFWGGKGKHKRRLEMGGCMGVSQPISIHKFE